MKSPFLEISDEVHSQAVRLGAHLARQGYRLEAIHSYTHPDGLPWWWVARWRNDSTGQKAPLPMRREEGGGFSLRRPEFPNGAPLYRLHKLGQYPTELVYLVEGESCADSLEALGFIATTWPNGSQAVAKADFRPLAGRGVVLWPDNDGPGFRAMGEARQILEALGALVVALDVERLGFPPKGDCVDWERAFVARHGARHLHEIPNGHALAAAEVEAFEVAEWKVAA